VRRSLWPVLSKPTNGELLADYVYPKALVGSVLAAILVFSCCFGFSYSFLVWYQSEFLALEIRAAGSAIATTSCWLANLVVSVAYLTQLKTLGAHGTYAMYAGFIAVGGIFIFFCYPETKGLSIDETGSIFEDGFGVRKAERMFKEKRQYASRLNHEAATA